MSRDGKEPDDITMKDLLETARLVALAAWKRTSRRTRVLGGFIIFL
jgi:hypothetical protein